jgi:hypothetical protein
MNAKMAIIGCVACLSFSLMVMLWVGVFVPGVVVQNVKYGPGTITGTTTSVDCDVYTGFGLFNMAFTNDPDSTICKTTAKNMYTAMCTALKSDSDCKSDSDWVLTFDCDNGASMFASMGDKDDQKDCDSDCGKYRCNTWRGLYVAGNVFLVIGFYMALCGIAMQPILFGSAAMHFFAGLLWLCAAGYMTNIVYLTSTDGTSSGVPTSVKRNWFYSYIALWVGWIVSWIVAGLLGFAAMTKPAEGTNAGSTKV